MSFKDNDKNTDRDESGLSILGLDINDVFVIATDLDLLIKVVANVGLIGDRKHLEFQETIV